MLMIWKVELCLLVIAQYPFPLFMSINDTSILQIQKIPKPTARMFTGVSQISKISQIIKRAGMQLNWKFLQRGGKTN